LGPFIMAPVNHSPARNKKTTTALGLHDLLAYSLPIVPIRPSIYIELRHGQYFVSTVQKRGKNLF